MRSKPLKCVCVRVGVEESVCKRGMMGRGGGKALHLKNAISPNAFNALYASNA